MFIVEELDSIRNSILKSNAEYVRSKACAPLVITDELRNGKLYNGVEAKFGVTLNGTDYIVKQQRNVLRNVHSEVIASNFIAECGYKAHSVYLGSYNGEDVAVCKDFASGLGSLRTLESVNSANVDMGRTWRKYYFDTVIARVKNLYKVEEPRLKEELRQILTFDAILGNPDRHLGNLGLYRDKATGYYHFTPMYDNGASLFPSNLNPMLDEDVMRELVFMTPNSKIMFGGTKEMALYYEMFGMPDLKSIREQLADIDVVQKMQKVCERFGISEDWAGFYATVVYYRHKCIIRREAFKWTGMRTWI